MARDEAWEVAAELLRADEAEMLHGLLESAGIPAEVDEGGTAGPFPVHTGFLGARVLVRAGDGARAREIVASSGVVPDRARAGEDVDIPEAEWRAPPHPAPDDDEAQRDEAARGREGLWLLVAAVTLALLPLLERALRWIAAAIPLRGR